MKLCRVSQVAADIEAARVPYSAAAKAVIAADAGLRETALTGGDDFEILCTVPPDKAETLNGCCKPQMPGPLISPAGLM